LLQFALRDVPVALNFQFGHGNPSFSVVFTVGVTVNVFFQAASPNGEARAVQ
jgi:muramoyltetrapeptide carboxypeptidase LdcA involved in peptidoglycan recycling